MTGVVVVGAVSVATGGMYELVERASNKVSTNSVVSERQIKNLHLFCSNNKKNIQCDKILKNKDLYMYIKFVN